jgi:hypothetical protein
MGRPESTIQKENGPTISEELKRINSRILGTDGSRRNPPKGQTTHFSVPSRHQQIH